MELLGQSQTFIGVIATVVILCIFKGKGNFIFLILKDIESKITDRVGKLKLATNATKLLAKIGNMLEKTPDDEKEKKKRYGELSSKVTILMSNVTTFHQIQLCQRYRQKIHQVKESEELLMAPYYVFGFTIISFVFDELLRNENIPIKPYLLLVFSMSVFFSSIYWLILWVNFMLRVSKIKVRRSKKYMGYLASSFMVLKMLGLNVLFLFSSLFLSLMVLSNSSLWARIIFILGLVLPSVVFGVSVVNKHPQIRGGYFLTLTCHLLGIFAWSFLASIILFGCIAWNVDFSYLLISETQIDNIRIILVLFILLNGLVLPFFIPLVCSLGLELRVRYLVRINTNKANEKLRQYELELNEI